MRLCLFVTGAHSGGHILPAVVLACEWKKKHPSGEVFFFTSTASGDRAILGKHDSINHIIMLPVDFKGRGKLNKVITMMSGTVYSFFVFAYYCLRYRPAEVIGTGGFIAVPTSIAAWLCRVRTVQYELNYMLGRAIKCVLPFLVKINIVFPETKHQCSFAGMSFAHRCAVVPYPLRFGERNNQLHRNLALDSFKLDRHKKTIFLLGGSQGSLFLSRLLQTFFLHCSQAARHVQVLHHCSPGHEDQLNAWYSKHDVTAHVFSFMQSIETMYVTADVVVCRAGAGTLFEVAFFRKKAFVIPLHGHAANHQEMNARMLIKQHPDLFVLFDQRDVERDAEVFFEQLVQHLAVVK